MTYTHYVDCKKWKKVIGISLWVGTCIALAFTLYITIDVFGTTKYGLSICETYFNYKTNSFDDKPCRPDYNSESLFLFLAILCNSINYGILWRTLNQHYRWLEIKCGTRPDELKSKENDE